MLRLCNPFSVQNQITPTAGKKYQAAGRQSSFTEHSQGLNSEGDISRNEDDDDGDDDDEMQRYPLSDGIRQKPKLARVNSAVSSLGGNSYRISSKVKTLRAVEDEIFLLTLDLKWVNRRYSEYEEQLLVASYDPQGNGKPYSAVNVEGMSIATHNQAFVTNDVTYLCYECEQPLPNNIAQLMANQTVTSSGGNATSSTTSSAFKSILVLVIRCTMANKAFANNINQQLQLLLSAMASLQHFVENYQELPKGFDMTSPYNHNCLNSIEYAFMFADVLMAANLKYLIQVYHSNVNSSADKALQCFFIQSGNNYGNVHITGGGTTQETNNSTHTTSTTNAGGVTSSSHSPHSHASFIRHIQELVNSLNNIVSYASDETTRTSTLIAYSHFLIKLNQVIAYCINLFEQRHQEMLKNFHHYYDSLQEIVTLVNSVIPCVQMIKQLLGHESIYYYILSIRYWHINEQLIWLMYFFANKISSNSPHRAMFMLWKQKLFAGIYSILPNPQEFFFELQRMETRKQNVLGLSDDFLFDNMIQELLLQQSKPIEETNRLLTMTKKAILNSLPPKSSARKDEYQAPPGSTTSALTEGIHFSPPQNIKKGVGMFENNINKVDVMSFHARFILLGMIRMIQLHPSYSLSMTPNVANQYYSSSMTVPMKEKYFIALYEILFHLLDVTVEKKGLFKPYLLPIIAHMLMKLSIGMDRKPSTDWVFWKMAKEMSRFNDYIKRRKAMQNLFFQQSSTGQLMLGGGNGIGGMIQFQASFSARSHDTHNFGGRPPTHRTNNTANLTHRSNMIDLNLDTPFKEMRPTMDSPSPVLSHRKHINISQEQPMVIYTNNNTASNSCAVSDAGDESTRKGTPSNVYNIGDLVDGNCTLPNGTQRWYPGKVIDIDMDRNTYTIQFDDGDIAEGKTDIDIRPTKQRRKRSTASQKPPSSNSSSARDKLEEKPQVPPKLELNLFKTPRNDANPVSSVSDKEKEKSFEPINTAVPVSQSIQATKPSFVKQPLSTILSVGRFPSSELPNHEDEDLLGTKEITRVTSRDLYDIHSEDEGDEDRIFEIPSVFDTDRDEQMYKRHGDFIPKMQLAGLPVSSSLPQMAPCSSLSSSLVCEDSISAVSSPAPTFHKSVPSLKIGSTGPPSRYGMLGASNPQSHRSDHGDDGSGRNPSLNLGPKFLELASNGNTGGPLEDLLTGNTRLQSWRQTSLNHMGGDDSSRFTGRTTGRNSILKPSSSNRLHDLKNTSRSDHTSTTVTNHPAGAKYMFNGQLVNGIEEDGVMVNDDEFSDENNMMVQYLLDTFGIITFVLIKHCLLQSNELDYHSCKPNESVQNDDMHGGAGSITSAGIASNNAGGKVDTKMISESTNVLFILREYLELTTSISSKYSIASYALFFEPGVYRLCKLLSPIFFDCCLKYHINSIECADKIGEGGFGSVYRVICPKSCNKFHAYSHCFCCYQKENCYFQFLTATSSYAAAGSGGVNGQKSSCCTCWKTTRCVEKFSANAVTAATAASTMKMLLTTPQSYFQKTGSSNSVVSLINGGNAANPSGSALVIDRAFAVKRIPRERSIHDSSVAFSLFQEISALEKMRNYIGVCGLEDYGVTGSEYWLVLESGKCNVNEWRKDYDELKLLRKKKEKQEQEVQRQLNANESVKTGYKQQHRNIDNDLPDEDGVVHIRDDHDLENSMAIEEAVMYLENEDVLLFMIIFLDMLLILRDVHTNDIAHFDVKGSNFILRQIDPLPLLSSMFLIQQQQRKPSGVLCLADFGESIVQISSLKDPSSVRQRARGTMCIQSPEMLCISEQTQQEMTTNMLNTLLLQQQQQVTSSLYSEMTMGDLLRAGGSFSRNSFTAAFSHSALNSQHNSNSSIQLQQQHATIMGGAYNKVKLPTAPFANVGGNNNGGGIKKKSFPLPDKTSDVWSLGCLLYELMTGNMLFADRTWPELYSKFCLDMTAGGPGSCGVNAMMAMSALGEKLFGKFADVDIDVCPNLSTASGISAAGSGLPKASKSPQKKFCATLLAMIEAGPLVEKMSRHISLPVQKCILRILCSCMQPDPSNRVPLMDLIDMADEVIQMLMQEHAVKSPSTSMALLATAANSAQNASSKGGGNNSQTLGSLGGISNIDGAIGNGPMITSNLNNSSSNIFDDLSFSLSVSLSGWTTDKKVLNNTLNNRSHLSGTMSPIASIVGGSGAGNNTDNFLTYYEEDVKVFLPYSLMTKVTDCVYVTSRTMFTSILQQFLQRRRGGTSSGNNGSNGDSSADTNELEGRGGINNNGYPIRHLTSYLGDYLHPLDSNYKLFKPCYDLQSSVYTHMAMFSNSSSSNGNNYNSSADNMRENSIENISASELFSDLINYLLHTNVIGSSSSSNASSELKSVSSMINMDTSKLRKPSTSSLFGGGSKATAASATTHPSTATTSTSTSNNSKQSVAQKYPVTVLKNIKTPIVWIRLQTLRSSTGPNSSSNGVDSNNTESEDEKLSQACGIVAVTVPIPEIPSAPSPVVVCTGNDANSASTTSPTSCKIDLKAISSLILEVSNIIHHTIACRGAAPIVVITVENHGNSCHEDGSNGVEVHQTGQTANSEAETPHMTATKDVNQSGNKRPLVPILLTSPSSAANAVPPPLSYIRSASVNSFGLRSNEYGETFSRLEVSFALAIAGFLSHASTKSEVEPISMEDAVHLLVRMFRLMPWMEDLLDCEVLFTFLCFCFRQDLMKA